MKKKISFQWIIVNLPEIVAAAAFLVTVTSTGINVFTRYVLKTTFFWYSDLNILMMAWMIFPGAAAAYKRKMHYGVSAFVDKLNKEARSVFDVFYRVLLLVIVITFFVCACKLCYKVEGLLFQSLNNLSYFWAYIAMCFGFFLIIIYSVIFLVQDINKMNATLKKEVENK